MCRTVPLRVTDGVAPEGTLWCYVMIMRRRLLLRPESPLMPMSGLDIPVL